MILIQRRWSGVQRAASRRMVKNSAMQRKIPQVSFWKLVADTDTMKVGRRKEGSG